MPRPACGGPTRSRCSAASSSPAGTRTRSRSTVLSGGERRRLALALVVASGANFLVLDEPTNHLDVESREALEAALEAFPGTVLLVTHDRALLDAVSGRVLAIEDGRLVAYAGGWAEYVRRDDEAGGAAAEAEGRQAEAGAPEAPSRASADADVARARRARDRPRRGARRRPRAPARRGLDERRPRRGPPPRPRRPRGAARALGGAVRGSAGLTRCGSHGHVGHVLSAARVAHPPHAIEPTAIASRVCVNFARVPPRAPVADRLARRRAQRVRRRQRRATESAVATEHRRTTAVRDRARGACASRGRSARRA